MILKKDRKHGYRAVWVFMEVTLEVEKESLAEDT